jgi:hypothetical protein
VAGSSRRRHQIGDAIGPGLVEGPIDAAKSLAQPVELRPRRWQIGLPERHSTTDVIADQRRIQAAFREAGEADRIAPAGVQVRHAGHGQHAGQARRSFQLLHGAALDPRVLRGDQHDPLGDLKTAIAHDFLPGNQTNELEGVTRTPRLKTDSVRTGGVETWKARRLVSGERRSVQEGPAKAGSASHVSPPCGRLRERGS